MFRAIIQITALVLTLESGWFLLQSNLGLSASVIAELASTKWDHNSEVVKETWGRPRRGHPSAQKGEEKGQILIGTQVGGMSDSRICRVVERVERESREYRRTKHLLEQLKEKLSKIKT